MYHTSLTNSHLSIDVFNTLIASVYLLNYCYILEIMARFADYDTHSTTRVVYDVSSVFDFSEIDINVSVTIVFFWRVGIVMSK